jgi:type I restriction enzyme R subunit
LDRYSFEESKEDGATLTIFYEGRMSDLFVEGIIENDDDSTEEEKKFDDYDEAERIFGRIFADLSIEEKAELKQQYITKQLVAESHERIRKISADIVEHFTTHIQPNGFKALLVAISR